MHPHDEWNVVQDIAKVAREGRLIIFSGAGVSMLAPSRSPSWWEIYAAAAHALGDRLTEGFPQLSASLNVAEIIKPFPTQQLANEVISRLAGESFVEILQVVDVADPNENHALIAGLAIAGALRGLVTTNFDTLVERAAAERGLEFAIITPDGLCPKNGLSVPYIKIHGSAAEAAGLIETSTHKAREVSKSLVDGWRCILPGAELLVIGYSGADLHLGAAGAFFNEYAAGGGKIWWLHRPNSAPALPQSVANCATFVEGTLPGFLRKLAANFDISTVLPPPSGADPQQALRKAMQSWSRKASIGKWGAATFFQRLGVQTGPTFRTSDLGKGLYELARGTAAQVSTVNVSETVSTSIGAFLDEVGKFALKCTEFDDAKTMARAAIHFYSASVNQSVEANNEWAEDECRLNLSASLNNFGLLLAACGERVESNKVFSAALFQSYLSGSAQHLFFPLLNILERDLGEIGIRQSMRIAELVRRLSDRMGEIKVSILARFMLAGNHLCRNEIWAASAELAEAKRLSAAGHEPVFTMPLALLDGLLLLKQCRIEEGITQIARAHVDEGKAMVFSRFVAPIAEFIEAIDGKDRHWVLKLKIDEVSFLIEKGNREIQSARSENRAPWSGRPWQLYKTATLRGGDADDLYTLGITEFSRPGEAVGCCLQIAAKCIDRGDMLDATWAARNVLANPHARSEQRSSAHSILARTCAELGWLEKVEAHLREGRRLGSESSEKSSPFAGTGMWHYLQLGKIDDAVAWAKLLGNSAATSKHAAQWLPDTLAKINSWGLPMKPVAEALRNNVPSRLEILLPKYPVVGSATPFREIRGTDAELIESDNLPERDIIDEAHNLVMRGENEQALRILEKIFGSSAILPERIAGNAAALFVHAAKQKRSLREIDRIMNEKRKYFVERLQFSALARLEGSLASSAYADGDYHLAATIFRRHSFVADLSIDARAAVSFGYWFAKMVELSERLRGLPVTHKDEFAAAKYYGVIEAS